MDFVNQGYAQLIELFRSMSAGTRLATALLLVIVVVSLAYLFQFQAAGGNEYLLGGRGFTQSEVTAIEAAFAKAGLRKSEVIGSQIRIPRGHKDQYLAALADGNALPADFYKYLDEAIGTDNPFSSSKSMDVKRWNAKQKELSLIIGRMSGIETATVQYDEEVKRGLTQQKQKTAMVAIQTRGGQIDEEQVKAIRNVVASAYAGLDRRNITITDLNGGTYGGAIGPDGASEEESIYAMHKRRYEREWQTKIQQQLSYIQGVIVGVNVELNPETLHKKHTFTPDPKPVPIDSQESTKEQTTRSPQGGGRVGAQVNGVETQGNRPLAVTTASSGPESQLTETRTDNKSLPGHDTTVVEMARLVPRKVTASIDIPASYYLEVWKKRNPQAADKAAKPPDQAELAIVEAETKKRLEETVRNLLPDVEKGANPWPYIVVQTYVDLPKAAVAPPSLASNSTSWLADNWQTLGVVGLGLLSLLMMRSMLRSTGGSPMPTSAAAPANSASTAQPNLTIHDPGHEDDPEPVRALKARFQTTGPDLKTELHDIVKENPDSAAAILRSWIGEAA
jgi:flagellar M-ring protein FliF